MQQATMSYLRNKHLVGRMAAKIYDASNHTTRNIEVSYQICYGMYNVNSYQGIR
jgi:hypothetical protein